MNTQRNAICLIEDDVVMGRSLVDRFDFEQVPCAWFTSLESAKSELASTDFAAIICDVRLPDGNGEEILNYLRAESRFTPPTIYITAFSDLRHAVRLLRNGAADYVTKPFDTDRLLSKLYLACPSLTSPPAEVNLPPVLGVSRAMREIQAILLRIAEYDVPVLITGESGVGKEYAAKYVHDRAANSETRPFVPVNCAAIPESLLESELFGHEAGAFTGSKGKHMGLFEQANGGTLFLDEIGDMTQTMQTKVLRALQEKTIRRVGGDTDILADFRLICATNQDLRQMVADKLFRNDLFYRINVLPITIPPLRERPGDIAWFADLFVNDFCNRTDRPGLVMSAAAKKYLQSQPWPGNVRELRSRIDRMCIMCDSDTINIELAAFDEIRPPGQQGAPEFDDLRNYLASCERTYILGALARERWRIGKTATRLSISRKSLWERMRRLGISNSSD